MPRRPHASRRVARLALVVGMAALSAVSSTQRAATAPAPTDQEDVRRALLAGMVKAETPVPSLTVLRDDSIRTPLPPSASMPDLLLYRVREGGLYQDPVGRVVRVVLAPPTEWVMFVEPQTNRVFRMSGFADGNDFNEMVRAYIRTVDRTDSLRLVDSYVALAYAPRSTPVASLYELRRAVEDVLYTARLDDAGITRHVQGWVNKEREAIEGVIEARMLVSDGGGFRARRSLVQVRGSGLRPVIEVHDLTLLVSERGEVRVAADDIVATLDLALQDGVGK